MILNGSQLIKKNNYDTRRKVDNYNKTIARQRLR